MGKFSFTHFSAILKHLAYGNTNSHNRRPAAIPPAAAGDLKTFVQPANNHSQKEWLKSSDVRKMLGISHGTLQNLRIKGVLPYQKLSGIMFYRYEDIARLLNGDKVAER